MDIGKCRRRVTVMGPSEPIPDGRGGVVDDPPNLGTFYAAIQPIRGRSQFNGQQLQATTTHLITMRGRLPVTPACKLVDRTTPSRTFAINAIWRVDELDAWIHIEATETPAP